MRDSIIKKGHSGTFALLAVLSAVEGAIATWLAVNYQHNHNYPNEGVRDRTRLLAFTSWATLILSVVYLGLFFKFSDSGNLLTSVGSHAIWLAIAWILWTAGVASVTAALGGGINCSTIHYKVVYCNQLNALLGFGWACWIVVTFAVIVVLIFGIKSLRRGEGMRGNFY